MYKQNIQIYLSFSTLRGVPGDGFYVFIGKMK